MSTTRNVIGGGSLISLATLGTAWTIFGADLVAYRDQINQTLDRCSPEWADSVDTALRSHGAKWARHETIWAEAIAAQLIAFCESDPVSCAEGFQHGD